MSDKCSFCDKPRAEVKHLMAAGEVAICDECILLGVQFMLAETNAAPTKKDAEWQMLVNTLQQRALEAEERIRQVMAVIAGSKVT